MFTARSPAVSGSGLLPSTTSVHGMTPRRYLDCVVSTLRHPLTILRRRWPGNRSTVSVDFHAGRLRFSSKVIVDSRTEHGCLLHPSLQLRPCSWRKSVFG